MTKATPTTCQDHGMSECPYCAKAQKRTANRKPLRDGQERFTKAGKRASRDSVLYGESEYSGSDRDGEPVAPQHRRTLYQEATARAVVVSETAQGIDRQ